MTDRIFDDEPLLECICADIISLTPIEGGFAAILNRTIFFPRGGGQPCDGGTIADIAVLDVYEENGELLHILASQPEERTAVACRINLATRLEHMQHHTAQHIFSACAELLFDNHTVIARIEENSAHIELERPLSHEQLMVVATKAREIISADLPITCKYYTPQEAQALPVRGKITPHAHVRLVNIEGFDLNACGGTHCVSTGAVKDICFTGEKLVRGIYRVYFRAGDALIADGNQKDLMLLRLGALFGCEAISDTESKITALIARCSSLEAECASVTEQLWQSEQTQALALARPVPQGNFIVRNFVDKDMKQIKLMCEKLVLDNCFVAISNRQGEYYNIIAMQSKSLSSLDIGQAVKSFLFTHLGKGGGSKISAQGMAPYTAQIESAFMALVDGFYTELTHSI